MEIIKVRNVNEALPVGIALLQKDGKKRPSRAGNVLEYPECVATVYTHPRERVLFSPVRDANPFFHFMESLWMLRGQNGVEWLAHYNSRMKEYSDDGKILHGAYGYRWRNHFNVDQISLIIKRLSKDPTDRRCVLQIWDSMVDLDSSKVDIPCNTHVYFKIRGNLLHMTVCCRSNDIIWGAYGANVVHFSMLQEYVAQQLKLEMGEYVQISDSYHAYVEVLEKTVAVLKEKTIPYPDLVNIKFPTDWKWTDFELSALYQMIAHPLEESWRQWKQFKDIKSAIWAANQIQSDDWKQACVQWLERRDKHGAN